MKQNHSCGHGALQKKYTETVTYISPTTLSIGESCSLYDLGPYDVVSRHFETFSEKHYTTPLKPVEIGDFNFTNDNFEANVLRLLIKDGNSININIPNELLPLKEFILQLSKNYNSFFPDFFSSFVHLTVRTTADINFYKNSSTWHVDGFQGARMKRHIPEINFIWSNCYPTEFLLEPFDVQRFDYTKYNINSYFRDFAKNDEKDIFKCKENKIYAMDPYMVHRSPSCDFNKRRIFIRLTFSPVPIEDPTNTINPMLYREFPPRIDVRDNLQDFKA